MNAYKSHVFETDPQSTLNGAQEWDRFGNFHASRWPKVTPQESRVALLSYRLQEIERHVRWHRERSPLTRDDWRELGEWIVVKVQAALEEAQ